MQKLFSQKHFTAIALLLLSTGVVVAQTKTAPDRKGTVSGKVTDAVSKGAKIANPRGGKRDKTFFAPTVLFPANKTMRIWNEERNNHSLYYIKLLFIIFF